MKATIPKGGSVITIEGTAKEIAELVRELDDKPKFDFGTPLTGNIKLSDTTTSTRADYTKT